MLKKIDNKALATLILFAIFTIIRAFMTSTPYIPSILIPSILLCPILYWEIILWEKFSHLETRTWQFILKAALIVFPYWLINYLSQKYLGAIYSSGIDVSQTPFVYFANFINRLISGHLSFVIVTIIFVIKNFIDKKNVTENSETDIASFSIGDAFDLIDNSKPNRSLCYSLWKCFILGLSVGGYIGFIIAASNPTKSTGVLFTLSELITGISIVAFVIGIPVATILAGLSIDTHMSRVFSFSSNVVFLGAEAISSMSIDVSISSIWAVLASIFSMFIQALLLLPHAIPALILFPVMILDYLCELVYYTIISIFKK